MTSFEDSEAVRQNVRRAYGATASGGAAVIPGDCGDIEKRRELLGYGGFDVAAETDLGLGCGNPLIAAKVKSGEVVVDLGSGAGVDCFLAAKAVGSSGRVIGVDMTPEMIEKARRAGAGSAVVSFRLGEIEHLPLGDGVADVVISNCVINLSVDKAQVYREMNRVLKPGGRVSVSDVLRTAEIPAALQNDHSYACWVAGASDEDEIRTFLTDAGFVDVSVVIKENAAEIISGWMPGSGAEKFITSAYVTATKPTATHGFRDDVFAASPAGCCAPTNPAEGEAAASGCCAPPPPPAEEDKEPPAEEVPAPAPVEPSAAGCWG